MPAATILMSDYERCHLACHVPVALGKVEAAGDSGECFAVPAAAVVGECSHYIDTRYSSWRLTNHIVREGSSHDVRFLPMEGNRAMFEKIVVKDVSESRLPGRVCLIVFDQG